MLLEQTTLEDAIEQQRQQNNALRAENLLLHELIAVAIRTMPMPHKARVVEALLRINHN
jgi:hypothetical protein